MIHKQILKSINQFRYVDWAITTPIMLLVLLIVFGINTYNTMPTLGFFSIVLLLNYLMLTFGFLNETRDKKNIWYQILGFVSFFIIWNYRNEIYMDSYSYLSK